MRATIRARRVVAAARLRAYSQPNRRSGAAPAALTREDPVDSQPLTADHRPATARRRHGRVPVSGTLPGRTPAGPDTRKPPGGRHANPFRRSAIQSRHARRCAAGACNAARYAGVSGTGVVRTAAAGHRETGPGQERGLRSRRPAHSGRLGAPKPRSDASSCTPLLRLCPASRVPAPSRGAARAVPPRAVQPRSARAPPARRLASYPLRPSR